MYANVEPSLDHSGLGRQTGREIYFSRFARKPKRSNLQTFEHAKPSNLQIFKPSNLQTFKHLKPSNMLAKVSGRRAFITEAGRSERGDEISNQGLALSKRPRKFWTKALGSHSNWKIQKSKNPKVSAAKHPKIAGFQQARFEMCCWWDVWCFFEITSAADRLNPTALLQVSNT